MHFEEAIFRIKKEKFTKGLVERIVDEILSNNRYSIPSEKKKKIVNAAFAEGKGETVVLMDRYHDPKAPYECYFEAISKYSWATIKKPLLEENMIYVGLSASDRYFVSDREEDRKIVEAFAKDARTVYRIVHPDWGAILHEISFGECVDREPSKYLHPTNFYGPELAKNIDINELKKLGTFKVESLEDGGLMVQLDKMPTGYNFNILEKVAKITHQELTEFAKEWIEQHKEE